MTTYSDITAAITAGTAEQSSTIKIPGGTRITQLGVQNVTGTGMIRYVRLDFPGMKTPQKYMCTERASLEGTPVGSGVVHMAFIDCDIPIPSNVSEVTFYVISDTASQTVYVAAKWTGP